LRIKITATPKTKDTCLPLAYNHYLQAFIYSLFREDMPDFHRSGYRYKKRLFKNFTFSRITSDKMILANKRWHIGDEICFFISFYDQKASETGILNLMSVKGFRLGSAEFKIKTIKTIFPDEQQLGRYEKSHFNFITLSPIVVYRTQENATGKKTIFYTPDKQEFYDLITSNLKRKAKSVGIEAEDDVVITPVNVDPEKSLAIVKYKDYYVKGHTGIFSFTGRRDYAKLALEAGIGSKNAQGFGMIRMIGN